MKPQLLKAIDSSRITVFKIKNRQGWAAICLDNLTEGKTPAEAFKRLTHPLRCMGFELQGEVPHTQS